MKTLLFSGILFLGSIFLFHTSDEVNANNDFESTTSTVSEYITKKEFIQLSPDKQKAAWVSRLGQAQKLKYTAKQKEIISQLVRLIEGQPKGEFTFTSDIQQQLLDLNAITPEVDFLSLVNDLSSPLVITGKGKSCDFCVDNLEGIDLRNNSSPVDVISNAPDCNCEFCWGTLHPNYGDCAQIYTAESCNSSSESYGVVPCCNRTRMGCGFLWLFSCNAIVDLSGC